MELGERWPVNLAYDSNFHVNRRVLLHAANLQHGTGGFTFPPQEGMLWIFSPEKSDSFGRVRIRDLGYQRPNKTLSTMVVGNDNRWVYIYLSAVISLSI
jgi:hypothetical protein